MEDLKNPVGMIKDEKSLNTFLDLVQCSILFVSACWHRALNPPKSSAKDVEECREKLKTALVKALEEENG